MKIVTVVGARPQFIKAAMVSRAFANFNKDINSSSSLVTEVIVHTGQHYDRNMSDVFFEEMEIPRPDYFLDINGLSHGAMTGQMLEKIESVLVEEKPEVVLVYGDTNTTLAGALAAAKLQLRVAHVEAGLRSYNRKMPEEINRVLTDHSANLLFCPTKQSVDNLKAEGIINKEDASGNYNNSFSLAHNPIVCLVGDVMLDAAIYYKEHARKPELVLPEKFILATIHRAENADNPVRLKSIFDGFEAIGKEIPIILPLHPRTRQTIETLDLETSNSIKIIDPVSYLEMIYMLKKCILVMTDSGGLQKEAFFFQKPCTTLRDETEWVELVENGFNYLAGSETENIYDAYKAVIETDLDFSIELYGDGKAGERIVNILAVQ
jgi:UDP-GlcNAc3NAcA epimerase